MSNLLTNFGLVWFFNLKSHVGQASLKLTTYWQLALSS